MTGGRDTSPGNTDRGRGWVFRVALEEVDRVRQAVPCPCLPSLRRRTKLFPTVEQRRQGLEAGWRGWFTPRQRRWFAHQVSSSGCWVSPLILSGVHLMAPVSQPLGPTCSSSESPSGNGRGCSWELWELRWALCRHQPEDVYQEEAPHQLLCLSPDPLLQPPNQPLLGKQGCVFSAQATPLSWWCPHAWLVALSSG